MSARPDNAPAPIRNLRRLKASLIYWRIKVFRTQSVFHRDRLFHFEESSFSHLAQYHSQAALRLRANVA